MDNIILVSGRDYVGIGVGAVIIRDNKILLLLRNNAPEAGHWSIPGGKVDYGETIEDALLRELREELGVKSRIDVMIGITNHILRDEKLHFVVPSFMVTLAEEPQNMEPKKHNKMEWFSISKLPENITMITQKALADFQTWKNNTRNY